jgi:pimeloyl-ACP methyl ester carboxylesterase
LLSCRPQQRGGQLARRRAASPLVSRGARRPSLYDLVDKMKTITAPALVMTGDEDWPCLEPGILMKQTIPTAALLVMANAGHGINT